MLAVARVAPVALRRRISPGLPIRYQWLIIKILIRLLWEKVPTTPISNKYRPFIPWGK